MTRKQALDKAAAMLLRAETATSNDATKYAGLAQLYMSLAAELGRLDLPA